MKIAKKKIERPISSGNYINDATSVTPAYVIYLIDASGSMGELGESIYFKGKHGRRIDVVGDLLVEMAYEMYLRSKRGVAERYLVNMYYYHSHVVPLTDNRFITSNELNYNIPVFPDLEDSPTNTAAALEKALEVLNDLQGTLTEKHPPPIVCHFTDGEFSAQSQNPSTLFKEIMEFSTLDGPVLMENIYFGDKLMVEEFESVERWPGIAQTASLSNDYAKFLLAHSSIWPQRYISKLNRKQKLSIKENSRLFFPAENVDILSLALTTSISTPRGE